MGFQHRNANARAKERQIQRNRDRRNKEETLWADKVRKKQRDSANNKNDDLDGEAIRILRVNAGHNQTEGPEDELDDRPENRGLPVVLPDIHSDIFIAVPEDTCEQ